MDAFVNNVMMKFCNIPDRVKNIGYRIALIGLFVGLSLISGCQNHPVATSEPETANGKMVTVVKGSLSESIELVGNLSFAQSSEVKWETDGVVEQILVAVDAPVKKGDILAMLTSESLPASVLTAEKTLIDANKALEDVKESNTGIVQAIATLTANQISFQATKQAQEILYFPRGDQLQVEMAYDNYQLAVQNFDYAKADYQTVLDGYKGWDDEARGTYFESYRNSYNTLKTNYGHWKWIRGVPENSELAVAQGNVLKAEKAFNEALETYNSYAEMPRPEDLQKAENNVSKAEASFNKRYVLAPFDGIVRNVYIEAGQFVKKDSAAIYIEDRSQAEIDLNLSEMDLGKVSIGKEVLVTADAIPGKEYRGVISQLDSSGTTIDAATYFKLRVTLNDFDQNLKSGMTVTVKIPSAEKKNTLLVPASAIYEDEGKFSVQLVQNGTVQSIEVQTGSRNANEVEIISDQLVEGSVLSVPNDSADGGSGIMTPLPSEAGDSSAEPSGQTPTPMTGETEKTENRS